MCGGTQGLHASVVPHDDLGTKLLHLIKSSCSLPSVALGSLYSDW